LDSMILRVFSNLNDSMRSQQQNETEVREIGLLGETLAAV